LKVYDFEKKCAMKMLDGHEGEWWLPLICGLQATTKKRVYGDYDSLYWWLLDLQSRILR
jgi:hypothetical protein